MDTAGAGRRPADAVGGVTAVAGAANASDELGAVATRYAELSREAREHAAHARSESTTRAYDADWRDFSSWCARYEQQALPAAAQTVANYLTEHAPAWRPATEAELARGGRRLVDDQVRTGLLPAALRRRLATIGVFHQAAGHDNPAAHPLVRDVLDGIARTLAAAGRRQASAATAESLVAMLELLDPQSEPRDARDAAVLLLGMTRALRRSALAPLTVADVNLDPAEGLEIVVRGSKTDQHHQGHVVAIPDASANESANVKPRAVETSPARALAIWIGWLRRRPHQDSNQPGEAVLPAGAPLWRPVARRQGADPRVRIGTRALSDRAIAEIVKACAAAAGLGGRWSGHSLRRGFATDAYAGADEVEIMRHGRWRSATTMRGYLEEGTRFRATHPVHRLTFRGPPEDHS